MKKLLIFALFFGLFGIATAKHAIDTNDPYINPSTNPYRPQPVLSCGFTEVSGYFSKNPPDAYCESPWHTNTPGYFPSPLGAVADNLRAFKNENPGKTFELVDGAGIKKGSCNSFIVRNGDGSMNVPATQASCNGARMRVRREVSFAASIWSVFQESLGINPVLEGMQNRSEYASPWQYRSQSFSNSAFAQGCEFYEKKEYRTIRLPNACPKPKSCSGFDNQKQCISSNLECEWSPDKEGGFCTDLVCKRSEEQCDPAKDNKDCVGITDKDGSPTPVCGMSSSICMSSLKCEQHRKCLSSSSRIATPIGEVSVTVLKVGDIVWTADRDGNRIMRTLVKVSRVAAPNHRVVHLVLADGRAVDVSAPHPTADGRTVGDLQVGEAYSGSVVTSAKIKPYEGTATYDILPAGDTGYYWANGILMGSTLQ